jgi:hypothetical protein
VLIAVAWCSLGTLACTRSDPAAEDSSQTTSPPATTTTFRAFAEGATTAEYCDRLEDVLVHVTPISPNAGVDRDGAARIAAVVLSDPGDDVSPPVAERGQAFADALEVASESNTDEAFGEARRAGREAMQFC